MRSGWRRSDIAGKRVDWFTPKNTSFPFGLIHLHGIGKETLADNPIYTEALDEFGFACACPHGERSWWSDRICQEFDANRTAEQWLLHDVLPAVQTRWETNLIALAGISMGGQGALRLGFKYPQRFPVVAGVASAIDFHEWYGHGSPLDEMYPSREHCRQDTATLHVSPLRFPSHIWFAIDPQDTFWLRGNERLHEKLTALGIPHLIDFSTSRDGHGWQYFNAIAKPMLNYLRQALLDRSRQLLG